MINNIIVLLIHITFLRTGKFIKFIIFTLFLFFLFIVSAFSGCVVSFELFSGRFVLSFGELLHFDHCSGYVFPQRDCFLVEGDAPVAGPSGIGGGSVDPSVAGPSGSGDRSIDHAIGGNVFIPVIGGAPDETPAVVREWDDCFLPMGRAVTTCFNALESLDMTDRLKLSTYCILVGASVVGVVAYFSLGGGLV